MLKHDQRRETTADATSRTPLQDAEPTPPAAYVPQAPDDGAAQRSGGAPAVASANLRYLRDVFTQTRPADLLAPPAELLEQLSAQVSDERRRVFPLFGEPFVPGPLLPGDQFILHEHANTVNATAAMLRDSCTIAKAEAREWCARCLNERLEHESATYANGHCSRRVDGEAAAELPAGEMQLLLDPATVQRFEDIFENVFEASGRYPSGPARGAFVREHLQRGRDLLAIRAAQTYQHDLETSRTAPPQPPAEASRPQPDALTLRDAAAPRSGGLTAATAVVAMAAAGRPIPAISDRLDDVITRGQILQQHLEAEMPRASSIREREDDASDSQADPSPRSARHAEQAQETSTAEVPKEAHESTAAPRYLRDAFTQTRPADLLAPPAELLEQLSAQVSDERRRVLPLFGEPFVPGPLLPGDQFIPHELANTVNASVAMLRDACAIAMAEAREWRGRCLNERLRRLMGTNGVGSVHRSAVVARVDGEAAAEPLPADELLRELDPETVQRFNIFIPDSSRHPNHVAFRRNFLQSGRDMQANSAADAHWRDLDPPRRDTSGAAPQQSAAEGPPAAHFAGEDFLASVFR